MSDDVTARGEPEEIPTEDLGEVAGGANAAQLAALADLSEADLLNALKQSLSQF